MLMPTIPDADAIEWEKSYCFPSSNNAEINCKGTLAEAEAHMREVMSSNPSIHLFERMPEEDGFDANGNKLSLAYGVPDAFAVATSPHLIFTNNTTAVP